MQDAFLTIATMISGPLQSILTLVILMYVWRLDRKIVEIVTRLDLQLPMERGPHA